MQTTIQTNLARLASLFILTASLVACGGGGGSDGATQNASAPESATAPTNTAATPVVPAANHAPTISGSAVTTVDAGKAYSFVPSASDADGDTLQFTISSMPTWAKFDAATGRLSGTPTAANVGSYEEIEISVTDGKASTHLAPFSIAVEAASPTSKNITVSWQPPTTNNDGSTLTNLNGYRILFGTVSGVYTKSVVVTGAGLTSYVLENLQSGAHYYIAMVSVNSAGAESEQSAEVVVDLT